MLLADFINGSISRLAPLYPVKEARSIVLMLCAHFIGTKSYTHIVDPEYGIPESKLPVLEEGLERLSAGEPVQYVIGEAEFYDHKFRVTPDVLIPRPETELLCREAIGIGSRIYRMRQAYGKKAWPVRILDLCTGSGCIAWTLALSVPSAEVIGVDLSEPALEIAKSQAFAEELKAAGASAPEFVRADVLDTESDFGRGEFDLILSNPPYIMDKEKPDLRRNLGFEPESALFVPDDDPLVFYRAIALWSRRYLTPEGSGLTEINELLGPETVACFKEAGFSAEIIKDFYNKNRFVLYHR